MSATMREALDEEAETRMPAWMKKAKDRYENGSSSEEDDEEDENFMGMKKKMEKCCYSDTTMRLLQRKRDLCNAIQYNKPVVKAAEKK